MERLIRDSNLLCARLGIAFSSGAFFYCESRVLFTRPVSTFSVKFSLKLGPTILFTHLKIILLQCFQFLVFSTINSIQTNPTCRFEWKAFVIALSILSTTIDIHLSMTRTQWHTKRTKQVVSQIQKCIF